MSPAPCRLVFAPFEEILGFAAAGAGHPGVSLGGCDGEIGGACVDPPDHVPLG